MNKIIEELNLENGSNYKISVLKKYKDREDLKRVLKMTYDRVTYTYGITNKNINIASIEGNQGKLTLEECLDILESKLCTREVTGNEAIELLNNLYNSIEKDSMDILYKVINRDLRINLGKTQINKVFKDLIVKPNYMRCDIYREDKVLPELDKRGNNKIKKGTARNISFPAILQLKADGTYREFIVENNEIECSSRSGEKYEYPKLNVLFSKLPDGIYTGELTVRLDDLLLEKISKDLINSDKKNHTNYYDTIVKEYQESKKNNKDYILPRSIGNGQINSDEVPHNNIICELWDYITIEEYKRASLKDRKNPCTITYKDRFDTLVNSLDNLENNTSVMIIPTTIVNSLEEASAVTMGYMKSGLEGGVLKDLSMVYKNGVSPQQLKLKVAFSIDVRIQGFIEGKAGTSREKTFGSIVYSTDDGLVQGSVSGFTDSELEDFNSRREQLIGTVMEIEGNDLTQARNKSSKAVSHPRFIELRNDKDYTDTLERCEESLESAKMFR